MTTLPPEIIKKIMKEYHSHPVADLLRAQVTLFPNLIPHDQDIICIGIHDGNNMYAPYHWSTKERECFNHSMKMEELVLTNKLIDGLMKENARFNDPYSWHLAISRVMDKMDNTYFHFNRHLLIYILEQRQELLVERFRQRLRWMCGKGPVESESEEGGAESSDEESGEESD